MAKKKVLIEKESLILSILGREEGQRTEETIKTETQPQSEQVITEKTKKRGRKKLNNREKKKIYSFSTLPRIYESAQIKAEKEGRTLSEVITEYLFRYGK